MKWLLKLFGFYKEEPEVVDNIMHDGATVVWTDYREKFKLKLHRTFRSKTTTIGDLYINGVWECFTLEDETKLRTGRKKVYGETAIPVGTYEVKITKSKKFKSRLPVIRKVPGFKGIRIHTGNTHVDTEGCILVGEVRGSNFIGRSRKAFNKLFKQIEQAQKAKKKITLEVS